MKLKRLLRFSLGTLLVLLTIACIWLGFEVNQVRFEKKLSKQITESGGRIRFDYEFDANGEYLPDAPVPFWSAALGEGFLIRIAEVSYTGTTKISNRIPPTVTGAKRKRVPDDVLEQLSGLRGLKRFLLSNTDVADDDASKLKSIRTVEYLRLDGNAISANTESIFVSHVHRNSSWSRRYSLKSERIAPSPDLTFSNLITCRMPAGVPTLSTRATGFQ